MLPSPAKRRRITAPDGPIEIAAGADSSNEHPDPTTPTRASYLSPTKSSLARSHPHLIARSKQPVLGEPRGKSLRDEILSKPNASETRTTIPSSRETGDRTVSESQSAQADENIGAIETTVETGHVTTKPRSPLRERGAMRTKGPEYNEDFLAPVITPTLVRRTESGRRAVSRTRSDEPELPPTPVQLGLSPQPGRPRGLPSSSSPRSSKSGSGRHRRRTRTDGLITSSPLKPKAPAPVEDASAAFESTREAQESEPDAEEEEAPEDIPADLRERQLTVHSLRKELQRLKEETEKLERAVEYDGNMSDEVIVLLRQLSSGESISPSHHLTNPSDVGDKTLAYLTLFTPSNIQLASRTETRISSGDTKIIHLLTVTAPPPWRPNFFTCTLEVTVDPEEVQVDNVRMRDVKLDRRRPSKTGLYAWATQRLDNPLHALDAGGMIWGIGRWFGAAVERAIIFHRLDTRYNMPSSNRPAAKDKKSEVDSRKLTAETTMQLERYLEMTQIQIVGDRDGRKKAKPKVMLIWKLDLGWSGSVTSNIEITVGGTPPQAEAWFKQVFSSLVPAKGVVGAFESVWEMARGGADAEDSVEARRGKRKRV